MAENDPKKIDAPASAKREKKGKEDVIIHVMPKEFLGKDVSVPEPPKQPPKPTPPPAPKPAVPPPAKPLPPKKKSKLPVIIAVVGVLILLLLLVGGFFFLQSIEEPVPEPEPTPEPIPDPEPEPEPEPEITQGTDTDSDGLTDREESLYGTDFRNPDTDGDTFLDGNEVFHRFDPLGFAPSTLLDTGSVVEYTEGSEYKLTYPRTWALSTTADGLNLRSATSASIDVNVEIKTITQTFDDWYQDTVAVDSGGATDLQESLTKNGYELYMSQDELISYIVFDETVYIFTYNLGTSRTIDYLQTFQMIINSFELIDEGEVEEEVTE